MRVDSCAPDSEAKEAKKNNNSGRSLAFETLGLGWHCTKLNCVLWVSLHPPKSVMGGKNMAVLIKTWCMAHGLKLTYYKVICTQRAQKFKMSHGTPTIERWWRTGGWSSDSQLCIPLKWLQAFCRVVPSSRHKCLDVEKMSLFCSSLSYMLGMGRARFICMGGLYSGFIQG